MPRNAHRLRNFFGGAKRRQNNSVVSQLRAAQFLPETYDEASHSIMAVLSTSAPALVWSWELQDLVYEELIHDKKAVRMDRIDKGCGITANHGNDVFEQIGRIEPGSGVLVDGRLEARILLTSSVALPEITFVIDNIKSGITAFFSIDYRVHAFEVTDQVIDGHKVVRATSWEPIGAAAVVHPADIDAMLRALAERGYFDGGADAATFTEAMNMAMENIRKHAGSGGSRDLGFGFARLLMEPVGDGDAAPAPTGGNTKAKDDDVAADLEPDSAPPADAPTTPARKVAVTGQASPASGLEIFQTARNLGFSESEALAFGRDNADAAAALAAMNAALAARTAAGPGGAADTRVRMTGNPLDKSRAGLVDALVHRLSGGRSELSDAGRDFRGHSLGDIGRLCLAERGITRFGGDRDALARDMIRSADGSMSTSDFNFIFGDAMNKSLLVLRGAEELTYEKFCRKGNATDFRTKYVAKVGGGPSFAETPEGGDYTFGKFVDEGENYRVATYSSGLMLSRQMIVNDDLDAISKLLEEAANEANAVRLDTVYDLLTSNPTMSDSYALFGSDHGNKSSSAAAPSVTTLGAVFSAMAAQTKPNGNAFNVYPEILLMPRAGTYLLTASQLLYGAITPAKASDVVPALFKGIEIVADSRIPAASWYGFASPGRAPVIEYAHLNGVDRPQIEQLDSSRMVGLKYGMWIDFGAGVIDWRGGYLNAA